MAGKQVKREIVIDVEVKSSKASKAGVSQAKKYINEIAKASKAAADQDVKNHERVAKAAEEAATRSTKAYETAYDTAYKSAERFQKGALSAGNAIEAANQKSTTNYVDAWKVAAERARGHLQATAGAAAAAPMIESPEEKAKREAAELQKKRDNEAKQRADDLKRYAAEEEAANRKVLESTKALLEASVTVAKGLAYVGIVSEENSQKMMQSIVMIEAGFNIIKGGISTYVAIVDLAKSAQAALLAQAAATEVLAAAQAKVAATGTASAVASGAAAGGAAAGRTLGAAGTAGVAGVAAGVGLKSGLAAAASSLGKLALVAGKFAAVGLAGAEVFQLVRRTFGDTSKSAESFVGSLFSYIKALRDAAKSTENLGKAERDRQVRLKHAQDRDARITAAAGFAPAARERTESDIQMLAELDPGKSSVARARDARARAASELEKAEAAQQAERSRADSRRERGESYSYADEQQAIERVLQARERQKAAEKEIASALKEQLDTRKQEVKAAQDALKTAEEAYKAEQKKTQGNLAKFGKLGAGDQARLADASARMQAGEAPTQADVDLFERTGFAQNKVEEHYANRAVAAGGENVLTGLGERKEEFEARDKRNQAEADLQAAKVAEKKAVDELNQALENLKKSAIEASKVFNSLQQSKASEQQIDPALIEEVGVDVGNSVASMGQEIERAINQVRDDMISFQNRTAAQQIS